MRIMRIIAVFNKQDIKFIYACRDVAVIQNIALATVPTGQPYYLAALLSRSGTHYG